MLLTSISSNAYLQHCRTNKLKEMLFSDAVLLSFSNNGSVKRTVRAILALLSSFSILNIFITITILCLFLVINIQPKMVANCRWILYNGAGDKK